MHLLFWVLRVPPVNSHFWAFVPLHVHICSWTLSAKFPFGTSMHLLLSELITGTALPVGGGVVPPPENGVRIRPADRGSPSFTSDSKAPTSSKANAYALPS